MKNETIFIKNLSKKINGDYEIKNVSIRMFQGEIVGIAGKNDSGVFILSEVLSGDIDFDSGEILISEDTSVSGDAGDLLKAGISHITSTPKLHMDYLVGESICITAPSILRNKIVTSKVIMNEAKRILQEYNINISPNKKNYQLSSNERSIVEILRAVSIGSNIIILSNVFHPYDPISNAVFFKLLKDLASDGKTIVMIGTDVSIPIEIADRLLVMYHGEIQGIFYKNMFQTVAVSELFKMAASTIDKQINGIAEKPVLLELKNISVQGCHIEYVCIKEGESVGFIDSCGNAFEPLAQLLNGNEIYSGEVWLRNKLIRLNSRSDAVENGIGFITRFDDEEMVMDNMTIADNILLMKLSDCTRMGFINKKLYRFASKEYLEESGIPPDCASLYPAQVDSQTRAFIPRIKWEAVKPNLIVMLNSFLGMDKQMYSDAYTFINKMKNKGVGLAICVSNKEEAIEICDRVCVIK